MSDELMDCTECQEQVHEYLQREVSEDVATAITAHIANCDHCEEVYGTEENFNQVLRDSCQKNTPEDIIAKIKQHIAELS